MCPVTFTVQPHRDQNLEMHVCVCLSFVSLPLKSTISVLSSSPPPTCVTSSCSLPRARALGATGSSCLLWKWVGPRDTASCSSSGLSLDTCLELLPHPTSPAGHRVTPHCLPPCPSWGHVLSRIFILLIKSEGEGLFYKILLKVRVKFLKPCFERGLVVNKMLAWSDGAG